MLDEDIATVRGSLTPQFRDLLSTDVQVGWALATEHAPMYGPQAIAKHCAPYDRQGMIEAQSHKSATAFDGARPLFIPNSNDSYRFYAVEHAGVIYMFSSTKRPLQLPRRAKTRVRMAARLQPHLIAPVKIVTPEFDVDGILAIVCHGSRIKGATTVDWIRVLVPDESYRHLALWVDLLDEDNGDGYGATDPIVPIPELPSAPVRIKTTAISLPSPS